ncbi:hypothetical protein ACS0Y3_00155 [Burkholderia gladioli]|uniref:hypothetical protein n=1 Tax=Burkholderia gladioli TaxID=28095 RepID=UPI0016418A92|nr:hypothetical protein [Burkholderia gladioli]
MTLQQPHHARHDVRQGQAFELAATVPRDAGCSMFPQRIIFAAPHAVIACVRIRLVDGGTNQDRCMNPLFDRFHESIEAQTSRKHRSRATVHARVSSVWTMLRRISRGITGMPQAQAMPTAESSLYG